MKIDETTEVEWTVFAIGPGPKEYVAGTVRAVTWNDAWDAAVERYGNSVNHVQANETGTGPAGVD